ncbi:MAG: flagellar hook-basal body complex protein FliE [Nocardioidaceae bacterium]
MSIPAIDPVGFTPMVAPTLPTLPTTSAAGTTGLTGSTGVQGIDPSTATQQVGAAAGPDFGQLLSQGLQNLQGLHSQQETLAVQAATGDLNAIHDYTIAATEASVATQLTTAVRNKALEAFQEIMRMSI